MRPIVQEFQGVESHVVLVKLFILVSSYRMPLRRQFVYEFFFFLRNKWGKDYGVFFTLNLNGKENEKEYENASENLMGTRKRPI